MRQRWEEPQSRPFDDPLAEELAWLMDSFLTIGPVSIGLDGLIGLIPGLGDAATNLVSVWIVFRAMRGGVHRAAVLRMILNLGIDSLVGSIPIAGDLFDFAYKANTKNLKIYRESLGGMRTPLRDWGFVVLVVLILLALMLLPVVALLYLIQRFTS